MDDSEIDEILNIITQGIFRGGLYKAEANPEQMESYLDENPIFNKTIELVVSDGLEFKVNTDGDGMHPELKKGFKNN